MTDLLLLSLMCMLLLSS